MSPTLSVSQYRDLLKAALPIASDADTVEPNLRTLFTPPNHRLALEPEVSVVRGSRGVGKTVWFKALQDPLLRRVVSDAYQLPRLAKVETHAAYGSELSPDEYPGPPVLADLISNRADPAQIWLAVSLCTLGEGEILEQRTWLERVRWVQANPEKSERALAAADRRAIGDGVTHLLLFDALDRLHPDRKKADALIGGILRLALDLRTRTRTLRSKVFIRHDMFDSSRLHFADASKLLSNIADLTWTEPGLYGLLFHQLGNAESRNAIAFRAVGRPWRSQSLGDQARWTAPAELIGDKRAQQEAFIGMAGQYMGTGHRKGHTYTWLPNHLMDGLGQVSPRSFLRALMKAVEVTETQYAGHSYPVHYEGIRRGVQEASRTRVAEINEDMPWVRLAIAPLEGLQVPTEQQAVLDRWREMTLDKAILQQSSAMDVSKDPSGVRTGPRDPSRYDGLVDQLIEAGVVTRRTNGRLDLPDVYRIAFNIGRRGGVPKIGPGV